MESLHQIGAIIFCYSLLFVLCLLVWKMKSENLVSERVINGNWILLHIRHAGGAFIMTVLPASFLPFVPEAMFAWPQTVSIMQVFTLMMTGLLLLTLIIKERNGEVAEKQVSLKGSSFHAVIHILLRSSFLISYEWFFRGCILFSCVYFFGTIPAVIINVALYALIHCFNGRKEMYGAVPFGLVLCIFSLWYQSVWPAILLHLLLSSLHESFILSPYLCKNSKPVL